jgi:hypothetical protein
MRDATTAAGEANHLVRTVMGHFTHAMAESGDSELLREVARELDAANHSAAEAMGLAREAGEAARSGDTDRTETLAKRAQEEAAAARVGADRAMYRI